MYVRQMEIYKHIFIIKNNTYRLYFIVLQMKQNNILYTQNTLNRKLNIYNKYQRYRYIIFIHFTNITYYYVRSEKNIIYTISF